MAKNFPLEYIEQQSILELSSKGGKKYSIPEENIFCDKISVAQEETPQTRQDKVTVGQLR